MSAQAALDFTQHKPNLERVSKRIGAAIVSFISSRIGREFHASELRAHVEKVVGPVAPGSSDRIMRDLRQRKVVGYVLVSRRDSLYRAEAAR